VYSYFDFLRKTNIVGLGSEGYNNFWSLDKFYIGIISLLLVIVIIYLIVKFSSERIKKEFKQSNA